MYMYVNFTQIGKSDISEELELEKLFPKKNFQPNFPFTWISICQKKAKRNL